MPVRPALVSLWSQPNSSAENDFVCSGVFVGPTDILTAAHAVQAGQPLWATAFGGPNSYPVRRRQCHPELDVALLGIESQPPDSRALPLDARLPAQGLAEPLTINGFFEARLEPPQALALLGFREADRHYLISIKQPQGQSGSPICTADGKVWAIAVRHYADPNVLRGAVIAVHQFADWLKTVLPGSVLVEDGPGDSGPTEASDPRHFEAPGPTPTQAALTQVGLDEPGAAFTVSVCVVTDNPDPLMAEIDAWRTLALRDPLLPPGAKKAARKVDLRSIFSASSWRQRLMDRLAVTSFSAYVYYATHAQLAVLDAAERDRRVRVEPLVQRLRKRSETLMAVRSDWPDIHAIVARATEQSRQESPRELQTPQALNASAPGSQALLELAGLVADAVAAHLARPQDEEASLLFEYLRTRIRFAMNVATHERHTRDRNPLP